MDAKKLFTMSENGSSEYCCNVVKIGQVEPIEGSDFLGKIRINGDTLVVRKDQVTEGMLLFYASHETQLHDRFLSVNNLYEIAERDRNLNAKEVNELVDAGKKDEAKKMVGFFNKYGRVRMIRLKGVPSMGFLFSLQELANFNPKVKEVNMEDLLNYDFDTIDGELFIKAFVPPIKEKRNKKGSRNKAQEKIDKFNRMIPGEFILHYDTNPLAKNIWKIKPHDTVAISVKIHGTSAIFSNIKTKVPIKLPLGKRFKNWLIDTTHLFKSFRSIDYKIEYGNVYSSRKVVQNKYINKKASKNSFYRTNVYGEVNEFISPFIEEGMTVYGEIFGFESNGKHIQKLYDYGCEANCNYFMPYRITTTNDDGSKFEWNVTEVAAWTQNILDNHPELSNRLKVIDILYHGTLADLYPNIAEDENWHDNVLLALQLDTQHFGMEQLEPLCKNKVPREGICVRIDNDEQAECFKLKCVAFKEFEAKAIDKGEVDREMSEAYDTSDEV